MQHAQQAHRLRSRALPAHPKQHRMQLEADEMVVLRAHEPTSWQHHRCVGVGGWVGVCTQALMASPQVRGSRGMGGGRERARYWYVQTCGKRCTSSQMHMCTS